MEGCTMVLVGKSALVMLQFFKTLISKYTSSIKCILFILMIISEIDIYVWGNLLYLQYKILDLFEHPFKLTKFYVIGSLLLLFTKT